MSKTRADLVDEVADLLNITGTGETLSAEDREKIERRIDPKIEELARRGVVYIPDANEIDESAFDGLATLVAEQCGPSFGLPRNPEARLSAETLLRETEAVSWGEDDAVEAIYY